MKEKGKLCNVKSLGFHVRGNDKGENKGLERECVKCLGFSCDGEKREKENEREGKE